MTFISHVIPDIRVIAAGLGSAETRRLSMCHAPGIATSVSGALAVLLFPTRLVACTAAPCADMRATAGSFRPQSAPSSARRRAARARLALACALACGTAAVDAQSASLTAVSRIEAPAASGAPVSPAGVAGAWGAVLRGYIARALATHPTSARGIAQVGAAQAALKAAQWQRAPTPSFSREYDSSTRDYNNVLRVEQPLWAGGQITAGIDSARAGEQAARYALEDGQRALALKVVQNWGDWVKAQRHLEALDELEKEHRELLDLIERRRRAGVVTVSDVGLARVRLSAVLSEQGQERVNASFQRAQLVSTTGGAIDAAASHDLDTGAPAAPQLDALQGTVDDAPAVAKALADVRIAEAEVDVRKAALHPRVSLRYERHWGAIRDDKVYIAVQSTLGAGLSAASAIDSQRAQLDAARYAVDAVRQELREQYAQEFTRMDAARQREADARAAVAAGREVVESYRRQFDAGRRSWVELLNMVRELHQLRLDAMDAQVDYHAALFRISLLMNPAQAVVATPPAKEPRT